MDHQLMAPIPASRQRTAPLDLSCAASYAQRLNNSAAQCIEYGQFQRAEASLTKALHLSRMHIEQKSTEMKSSRCYHHTLDGCIQFTESRHPASNASAFVARNQRDRTVTSDFVYRRAIQIPPLQPSEDCCSAGDVLSIVIVFNLGLTMQLRAIEKQGEQDGRAYLQKALRLYEVAYNFLHQYYSIGGRSAAIQHEGEIQFRMILCNNLYQVYQELSNSSNHFAHQDVHNLNMQQEKYRDELLSALMFIVERQGGEQGHSDENESSRSHDADACNSQMRFVDLDGFWKTVEHLVLSSNCADTA